MKKVNTKEEWKSEIERLIGDKSFWYGCVELAIWGTSLEKCNELIKLGYKVTGAGKKYPAVWFRKNNINN